MAAFEATCIYTMFIANNHDDFTWGEKKTWKSIKKCQNIMSMIVPLVRVSVTLDLYFGGSKGLKSSQKGPFRGCWIGTQNFEKF